MPLQSFLGSLSPQTSLTRVSVELYLESVLPHAYDPTLEPFNTRAQNPKSYPEQNKYGFHTLAPNPYHHTYDNGDKYFTPENKEQVI